MADVVIERHRIGHLQAPSGRIIACDPYYCGHSTAAFRKSIPPGRYPVELSIAHLTSSEYSVALAILQLRDNRAVKWELAEFEDGQSNYPVDFATGCFMDAAAVPLFLSKQASDEQFLYQQMLIPGTTLPAGWAGVELDAASGLNLIVFDSGAGDGTYESYWGYDENGDTVCLVTDFQVIDAGAEILSNDQSTASQPPPEGASGGTITVSPW